MDSNRAIDGGALYGRPGSVLNLQNALVKNNTAGRDGGGLFVASELMDVTLGNSILHDNGASGRGGAIYVEEDTLAKAVLTATNVTIAHNSAGEGGGLYIGDVANVNSRLSLHNSIAFANVAQSTGQDAFVASWAVSDPNALEIDHSFIGPRFSGVNASFLVADCSSSGFIDAAGGGIAPGWVSASLRDYRLVAGSVCIDQGNDFLLRLDAVDIDDDAVPNELYPREYFTGDEALVPSTASTREIDRSGGTYSPAIGVDSSTFSMSSLPGSCATLPTTTSFVGICDIGAYENRDVYEFDVPLN